MWRPNLGSSRSLSSCCQERALFQAAIEVKRERFGSCGRRRARRRGAVPPAIQARPACAALRHGLCRLSGGALKRIASPIEQTLILILSDINMPGMTGLEMLPKAREIRPDVPIIMITAYGDPETKRKALEGGATGLLTKPIDFVLLRSEIDARLGQAGYQ